MCEVNHITAEPKYGEKCRVVGGDDVFLSFFNEGSELSSLSCTRARQVDGTVSACV